MFHGQGVYYHNNGQRYEGLFANDKKSGEGILYKADGSSEKKNYKK